MGKLPEIFGAIKCVIKRHIKNLIKGKFLRHLETLNLEVSRSNQFERKLRHQSYLGFGYALNLIKNDDKLKSKKIIIVSDLDESSNPYPIPQISSIQSLIALDGLDDYVFLVYFKFDSQALPIIEMIVERGGTFFPLWSALKTPSRFRSKSVYESVSLTFQNAERLSHLNKIDSISIHENICEAIEITRHLLGDYVEIGCYLGSTSFTAANYMKHNKIKRKIYLTDTFSGFSQESSRDSSDRLWYGTHKVNMPIEHMRYVSDTFKDKDLDVVIYRSDICIDPIHESVRSIVIANIDVDQFEATLAALLRVHPLMVQGGIIVLEDTPSTPLLYGASLALKKFLDLHNRDYLVISKQTQDFLIRL